MIDIDLLLDKVDFEYLHSSNFLQMEYNEIIINDGIYHSCQLQQLNQINEHMVQYDLKFIYGSMSINNLTPTLQDKLKLLKELK